jgi:hypothetical protein
VIRDECGDCDECGELDQCGDCDECSELDLNAVKHTHTFHILSCYRYSSIGTAISHSYMKSFNI